MGDVKAGVEKAKEKASPGSKVFTGGDQGFVDLKLESIENINHNVKKFRFALPESEDVSGLHIACRRTLSNQMLKEVSANACGSCSLDQIQSSRYGGARNATIHACQ